MLVCFVHVLSHLGVTAPCSFLYLHVVEIVLMIIGMAYDLSTHHQCDFQTHFFSPKTNAASYNMR